MHVIRLFRAIQESEGSIRLTCLSQLATELQLNRQFAQAKLTHAYAPMISSSVLLIPASSPADLF